MKKSPETRFLSLILALVLSFSLCGPALADFDPSDYSDVSEKHWAYDNIMYCSEWEIVKGFEDGTFRPEGQVTYAQFIAMLARTFYADEVAAVTDAAGQPWYYPYIKAAENKGITNGLSGIGDTPISRYDMAVVLDNIIEEKNVILLVATVYNHQYLAGQVAEPLPMDWAYQWGEAAKQSIRDWNSIPGQYGNAVTTCYALGALSGMSDGTFSGTQSMTRAQACVVITRMKDLSEGKLPDTVSQPQQPEPPAQTGTGLLANGQPATVENVQAILDQIKQEYPKGTPWGDVGTANNNYYKDGPRTGGDPGRDVSDGIRKYGAVDLKYCCGGWAAMVSERIFGKTGAPCREVTDLSKVRPGDIVVSVTDGRVNHVSIALYYTPARTIFGVNESAEIHTCDGNMSPNSNGTGGTVSWDLGRPLSNNRTTYHVLTRYPEGTESETL